MKTLVKKRSIVLNGRKTSVALEDQFWDGLREVAEREKVERSALVRKIDKHRKNQNLSSAIRVYLLNQFRVRVGHQHKVLNEPTSNISDASTDHQTVGQPGDVKAV